MKKIITFMTLLFVLTLSSCNYGTDNLLYHANSVSARTRTPAFKEVDFSSTAQSLPDQYKVLVLTDTHIGNSSTIPPITELYNYLDSMLTTDPNYPKFYIHLGDQTDHGYASECTAYKEFTDKLESKYGLSTFNVVGNHDLYNSGWDNWVASNKPGTSFYRFKTKTFSWYGIDTGSGTLGTDQYDTLKTLMYLDTNPKVVLMHYPLSYSNFVFCLQDTTERNNLISLFKVTSVKDVLCGHVHSTEALNHTSFTEYCFPSFTYQRTATILSVDESAKTIDVTFKTF
jgi:3',5'-cyclic-AMP phosphodiesterase